MGFIVVVLFIVVTSIWVGVDSSGLMRGLSKEERKKIGGARSPAEWVIGCLLLWIIGFPWYLSKRGTYSAFQHRRASAAQTPSRLATCSECGRQYAEPAKFCPSCGARLKQPEEQLAGAR